MCLSNVVNQVVLFLLALRHGDGKLLLKQLYLLLFQFKQPSCRLMIILKAIVLREDAWLISDILFLFLCQVFLVLRWQG
jgi:hypothetical protein